MLPTDAEKSIGNTVHIHIMHFLKYAPHFNINVVYVKRSNQQKTGDYHYRRESSTNITTLV